MLSLRRLLKINYDRCVTTYIKEHEKILLKIARFENHYIYLKRCKNERIIPNPLKFKVPLIIQNKKAEEMIENLRLELLDNQIEETKHKLRRLNKEERIQNVNMYNRMKYQEYRTMMSWHSKTFWELKKKIADRQKLKFKKTKAENKEEVTNYIMNLSKHQLDKYQMKILNRGIDYSMDKKDILDLNSVSQLNSVMYKLKQNEKEKLTERIRKICNKPNRKENMNEEEYRILKGIKNNKDIIIDKADKGNIIVIMDKEDYRDKLNDLINNNKYEEIKRNPTYDLHKIVKEMVKNMKERGILNERNAHRLVEDSCTTPRLIGRLKVHKENKPMRPIINARGSPFHEIARWVNNIIMKINFPAEEYIVKNTFEARAKLEEATEKNKNKKFRMYSMDVQNMFTCVPVQQTLTILEKLLFEQRELIIKNKIDNLELMHIIKLITSNTYFSYDSKLFTQKEGFPMGSALSGTLSNLYLNFNEKIVLKKFEGMISYIRYADDIYTLWYGSKRQFAIFTKTLNNIHKDLNFTVEEERDGTLNYLDMSIIRKDNRLIFKSYRKEFASNHTLNYKSNHARHIKINMIKNQVNRINNLSSEVSLYKEDVEAYKKRLRMNSYPNKFINKVIEECSKQKDKVIYDEKQMKLVLPYMNKVSYELKKLIQEYGYKVMFTYRNKIQNFICNKIHDEDSLCIMGAIYRISCLTCSKFYVGESYRPIQDRLKEHKGYIKNKKTDLSELAVHFSDSMHKINPTVQIVKIEKDCYKRKSMEAIIIRFTKENNINRCEGMYLNEDFRYYIKEEINRLLRGNKFCYYEEFEKLNSNKG